MSFAARKALERLWTDRATIIRMGKDTDSRTKLTEFYEESLLTDVPCKLSFETLSVAEGEPVAAVAQTVKLFLSPEVIVPAGCKVVVTRPNSLPREFVFASSGEPGVFHNHQEVSLSLWKGWA